MGKADGQARHEDDRHLRAARGLRPQAHQGGRARARDRVPDGLLPQPCRRALDAQWRRRDCASVRRRVQARLRHPHPRAHHRLRVHAHVRRHVRPARPGRLRRHQHRHQGGWDRRATGRHRGGDPGGHGVVRGYHQRQDLPSEIRAQPQRALNRAVPDPRGQVGADREAGRAGEDGGGRVLRHRDVRLHRPRVRHRGGRVLPLHEELRRRPHPPAPAAGEAAAEHHQQELRHPRLLSSLPGQAWGDQVPDGAEEPRGHRHRPAVPAAVRHQGQLRRPTRAHHLSPPHLQGGRLPRRRLLAIHRVDMVPSRYGTESIRYQAAPD
mmetsp:Transcript_21513/g.36890  ORF Transcript_21513/g.36890 Transcript_21513/m.36890 type:complete len:323 (+) Transcript_21513:558-1526(+)